ncbi:MAG TPA: hypothetical protein VI056_01205 [Candidatus Limnocylindria bacterium]
MSPRVARPIGIAAVAVTLGALAMYPVLLDAVPPAQQPPESGGNLLTPAILIFATVGALILWHRPGHAIGWVYAATGVAFALSGPLTLWAGFDNLASEGTPRLTIAGFAAAVTYITGLLLPLTYGLLLFPDGHLPSPRWRPVAWAVPVTYVLMIIGARGGPAAIAGSIGVLALAIASFASLFRRFRRASGTQRQQLKWAISGIGVLVVSLAALVASSTLGVNDDRHVAPLLLFFALAFYPLSVGIAILRHRLYDIDVLINRALVYGATTATLVATYALGVLAAHALLRPFTQGNELAVAASTLAVAALVQPVRRRIQSAVDRRFYRSRYDAERTVDALAARMRDEVDIEALRRELVAVARDTMHPTHASVWLRERAR